MRSLPSRLVMATAALFVAASPANAGMFTAGITSYASYLGTQSGLGECTSFGIAAVGSGAGFTATGPGGSLASGGNFPVGVLPITHDQVRETQGPSAGGTSAQDAWLDTNLVGIWTLGDGTSSYAGSVSGYTPVALRQSPVLASASYDALYALVGTGFTGALTLQLASPLTAAISAGYFENGPGLLGVVGTAAAGASQITLNIGTPLTVDSTIVLWTSVQGSASGFAGADVSYWDTTATIYNLPAPGALGMLAVAMLRGSRRR